MCFSTEASLTAGAILIPAGFWCLRTAARKNLKYLPLAFTPVFFGMQQICEAFVWTKIHKGDAVGVLPPAFAFLFFAIGFWPGWVPFTAAFIETRPSRRNLFFAISAAGYGLGLLLYIPLLIHSSEWLEVGVYEHSIQYDLSRVPVSMLAGFAWQAAYLGLVCVPLMISRERNLSILGVSVFVSAVLSAIVFRYVFASVWCFFAAFLSLHMAYVLYRLPKPEIPSAVKASPTPELA
jgi:hypothetical protein